MGWFLTDFTPSTAAVRPFLASESLMNAGLLEACRAKNRHFPLFGGLEPFSDAERAKLVAQKSFVMAWDGF